MQVRISEDRTVDLSEEQAVKLLEALAQWSHEEKRLYNTIKSEHKFPASSLSTRSEFDGLVLLAKGKVLLAKATMLREARDAGIDFAALSK